MTKIEKSLLLRYVGLVIGRLPLKGYSVRLREGWRWRRGALTLDLVERHLRGDLTIAVVWKKACRFFVIDIDNHPGKDRRPFDERLGLALAALEKKATTPLLVRSSASKGVHLYVFLQRAVEPRELRRRVIQHLKRHGIEIAPGEIEVWPAGQRRLRLPLGRGSAILCDKTLQPLCSRETRAGLRRAVPQSIELFCRLAEERRVRLPDVVGRRRALTAERALVRTARTASRSTRRRTGASTGAQAPLLTRQTQRAASDWSKRISNLEINGITEYGDRNRAIADLEFELFVRGMTEAEALAFLEDWLRTKPHQSRDLQSRPAVVIRDILQGFRKRWSVLEAQAAQGLIKRRARRERRRWEYKVSGLRPSPADDAYVRANASSERLGEQLVKLLPYLSGCADGDGFVRCVFELPTSLLQTIAGKKSPGGQADYFRLLQEAERLLGLWRASTHARGRWARHYGVRYQFGSGIDPAMNSLDPSMIAPGMIAGLVPGSVAERSFQTAEERAALDAVQRYKAQKP